MRIINTEIIKNAVKEMCIEANHKLSNDMESKLIQSVKTETSDIGKMIIDQLVENIEISKEDNIPICQDTGMVTIFLEIGQEIYLEGQLLDEAINDGIRIGYEEGYLRKSIVKDPIIRINTRDNTPGIIHTEIVKGDKIRITIAPKGFGSENMSKTYMLKPSDGVEGIKTAIMNTVKEAGPNACPPLIVGVGIGGNFEMSALLAKKALLRNVYDHSELEHIRILEEDLLEEINNTGIGPAGLGGRVTALAVNILTYPTHIAGLPLSVNLCCHVNRHVTRVI